MYIRFFTTEFLHDGFCFEIKYNITSWKRQWATSYEAESEMK